MDSVGIELLRFALALARNLDAEVKRRIARALGTIILIVLTTIATCLAPGKAEQPPPPAPPIVHL